MLPLPKLDDRTFEQLVKEARELIPGIFPDWTDENAHDPGMTLLEMLAWHLETQGYVLDRLTTRHERKFLKLLGEELRDRQSARTRVVFDGNVRPVKVAEGTLLYAGEIPFETEQPLTVFPVAVSNIVSQSETGVSDVSASILAGTSFYPFGPAAKAGSRMEMSLGAPLPAGERLTLWIDLAKSGGNDVRRIPEGYNAFVPSARVVWEYTGSKPGEAETWEPLALESDETYSLHQSGSIRFIVPDSGIRKIAIAVVEGEYDQAPLVRRLLWNETPAAQGRTLCIAETFDSTGEANQSFLPEHALFGEGVIEVQVRRDDGGWVDWEETDRWPESARNVFRIERSDTGIQIVFGDGERAAIPPKGEGRIRIVAVSGDLTGRTIFAQGTGIAWQNYPLPVAPVLPEQLQLQVGWVPEGSPGPVWFDWERVRDFDCSEADDMHFIIDDEEGLIRFSDGVCGAVPPSAPLANIRLIGCRIGGGEGGNVKEGHVRVESSDPNASTLKALTIVQATGGAEPETVEEAMNRVRGDVLEPDCGVTAQDIERIVKNIPGLGIVRTKAIPGFRPGLHQYPAERALGHISVVIVPASNKRLPRPSAGMLETVRNHLEPYRLLTTKFHVIAPEYVTVSVRAVVVVDPRFEGRQHSVQEALDRLLQPFGKAADDGGWEFGRPVYKGDVYDAIHRVPGVIYIQDVWLTADGKDVRREEGGDIRIPPNALAVSGHHEIEFLSSN